ncbi:hypothetical protein EV202_14310 [Bacteroides heparinolyticus]|uniref:Uncharacterized protein n=2 Tax=Prevotella heparinolytica TaxID=28113 RepID=A0A4R2LG02_9BACE|nr:hypothetical protein EV202_14310 [Bacteroides heparinolyticus]
MDYHFKGLGMAKKLAVRTGEIKFLPKGEKGTKGAQMRSREWAPGVSYLEGKDSERYYDIVLYNKRLYLCMRSHVSSSVTPQEDVANNGGNWALAQDWAFIATKLLLAERIKAEQIDTANLVARVLKTAFDGPRVEIAGSMMQFFGNVAANIRFGVNEAGYAVLEYYDNDGRKLYDLGPNGITQIPVSAEYWATARYKKLSTDSLPGTSDIERLFQRKEYKQVAYSDGTDYFKFYSKMVGPSYEYPDKHQKVFVSKNITANYIPNGWYVDTPSSDSPNAQELMQVMVGDTGRRLTSSDIPDLSPYNEAVYDYGTIYCRQIMQFAGGGVVDTVTAYWNG